MVSRWWRRRVKVTVVWSVFCGAPQTTAATVRTPESRRVRAPRPWHYGKATISTLDRTTGTGQWALPGRPRTGVCSDWLVAGVQSAGADTVPPDLWGNKFKPRVKFLYVLWFFSDNEQRYAQLRWLSARLWYCQCNGDTIVLHKAAIKGTGTVSVYRWHLINIGI